MGRLGVKVSAKNGEESALAAVSANTTPAGASAGSGNAVGRLGVDTSSALRCRPWTNGAEAKV